MLDKILVDSRSDFLARHTCSNNSGESHRPKGRRQMVSGAFQAIIVMCALFASVEHAVTQEPLLFDLKRVADRPASEVEKILGKPSKLIDDVFRSSRGNIYSTIRAAYRNDAVAVTYIEGGARYLTIWLQKLGAKYQDYSYPKDGGALLGDLGLDRNATADFSNQASTRWSDFPGIYAISIFPTAENKISHAQVFINRIYE